MRYFFLAVTLMFLGCNYTPVDTTPEQPEYKNPLGGNPVKGTHFNLNLAEAGYHNLMSYPDTIIVSGSYNDGRLIFKNASNKTLIFINAIIDTDHSEDAIVFSDKINNLTLFAVNCPNDTLGTSTCEQYEARNTTGLSLRGAITFWQKFEGVTIDGINIVGGHTGIRATQDFSNNGITIKNCNFSNITHEAIYLGVSKDTPNKGRSYHIYNNTFEGIGWDAIQVGNVHGAYITDNTINYAGVLNEFGQDYAITVNYGSVAFLDDNTITNTRNKIQSLDAKCFELDLDDPASMKLAELYLEAAK